MVTNLSYVEPFPRASRRRQAAISFSFVSRRAFSDQRLSADFRLFAKTECTIVRCVDAEFGHVADNKQTFDLKGIQICLQARLMKGVGGDLADACQGHSVS